MKLFSAAATAACISIAPVCAYSSTATIVISGTGEVDYNVPDAFNEFVTDFTLTLVTDSANFTDDETVFSGTPAEGIIDYYDPLASATFVIDGLGTFDYIDPSLYRVGYNKTTGNFFFDTGSNSSSFSSLFTVELFPNGTDLDLTQAFGLSTQLLS